MKTLGLLLLPVIALYGCNSSSSNTSSAIDSCKALNSDSFSCEQMLDDIVEYAVKPTVASFSTQAQNLATETAEYCTALTTTTNESAALTEAQTAWQESMSVWQQLEVMQFGPLATERDEFYSWPLNDSCKVDEEVVFSLADGYDISSGVTPARRGLDGLEYLLFNADANISCGANNSTAALTAWNEKDDAAKFIDRCSFAEKVTADLVVRAQALEASYSQYDITSAASLQVVADSISDALFYIDKEVKDDKLTPLIPQTGTQGFSADKLEFAYASYTKQAIKNNALAVKAIFTANGNEGLAQYLIAAGQGDLATEMTNELDTIITNSSDAYISDTFRNVLTAAEQNTGDSDVSDCINADVGSSSNNLIKLCALDNDVKAFTDDLKGQFVLTLGFSVPTNVEGDND
jgi:uncharacterized protein